MTSLQRTIDAVRPLCTKSMEEARRRQDQLTKPLGSLGRLEELSVRLAGIMRTARPRIRDKVILTMAGDHGVVDEGVALYPRQVTVQQVMNFLRGAKPGDIHAEAQMLRLGRRNAVCDVRLWTESPERLAAQATVTYAIP